MYITYRGFHTAARDRAYYNGADTLSEKAVHP